MQNTSTIRNHDVVFGNSELLHGLSQAVRRRGLFILAVLVLMVFFIVPAFTGSSGADGLPLRVLLIQGLAFMTLATVLRRSPQSWAVHPTIRLPSIALILFTVWISISFPLTLQA